MTRLKLIVALLAVALLIPVGDGFARKVGNPGNFSAVVNDGLVRIKDQTFTFDDSDPDNQVEFAGTVDGQGNLLMPTSQFDFPPIEQTVSGFDLTIHINVVGDPTDANNVKGTLNPITGVASVRLRVWIKIDGVPFGGGCRIASAGSPIDINTAITGTTSPPGPNTPISGTPYNTSNGRVKIVNNSFSVPSSSDCGPAAGSVNDAVGLPSASGNNEAQLTATFNPILTKGVNASFNVTPNSGNAPLATTLNASGSFVPAGVRTCTPALPSTPNCGYRWDYDNNGTVDEVTNTASVNHIYLTPGNYTTRLTVFDNDQDSDTTTRTVNVGVAPPDLSITKSHSGNFIAGQQGAYTIGVANSSAGPTAGTVTVSDTLPTGLSFVSAAGTGWSCGAMGQVVTCTRPSLAGNSSAPNITLTTAVGLAARPSVTNTATVSTTGDSNPLNNSASDPTIVDAIDLAIDKSHDGIFAAGFQHSYSLRVTSEENLATTGPTAVEDTLPAGLTFDGYTAPAGWTCNAVGQDVECTHAAGIAPGADDEILINVDVDASAVPGVTNTATVSTAGDADPANNSDSDPTTVVANPDLSIDKSHSGDFRVGTPGNYTLSVSNVGARATAGTTTVSDTLPSGLVPTGATGSGWSCNIAVQDVSCTSAEVLDPGEDAPPITLTVDVEEAALPSATNSASVATDGTGDDSDPNPANDSDTDPTNVSATDLSIDKSHAGGFAVGLEGDYTIEVTNESDATTEGTTTVTDTLPAELSFVSATGTGWSCGAVGQDVTCTRSGPITPGLTAPAITLTVLVALTEEEEVTNTATVSGDDDINPANDSDSDPTSLTSTDLALTKSHTSDFRAGTTRAYLLHVNNIGSGPTVGTTTVTDTLPEGLTYVNGTGSGWDCDAAAQEVTCDRDAAIATGDDAPPITLQVAVGAAAYPGVTNTATVDNQEDRNDANDTANDPTVVHTNDLAIAKTHTGSLHVGGQVSYEIDVANNGDAATNAPAVVSDTLPEGLTFAGSSGDDWSCEAAGQDVSCEHDGSIPAGGAAQTLELLADIDSDADSQITNEASVAIPEDPDLDDNSDDDTADVGRIDLAIDKSHAEQLPRGGQGDYTIDVGNEGDIATAGGTHVSDTLPAGLTYAGASGTGWSCGISAGTVHCDHAGPIAPGGSAAPITLTVNVDEDIGDEVTNTASVSTTDDVDSGNDTDSDPTNVSPSFDAAVSIRPRVPDGAKLRVGTNATYTVSVRNTGSDDLSGPITATVTLPAGLSLIDFVGDGWSCAGPGPTVTCTHAAGLPEDTPLSRSDVALEVSVAKEAVPSATTSVALSAPGDSNAANDTDQNTIDVEMIDLDLSMSSSGGFAPGGQGTFTIEVGNIGSADAVGDVTVTDTLPSGITSAGATGAGWSCAGAVTVTCTHTQLDAGEAAADISLTVNVPESAAGQSLSNTATAATAEDGDTSNNSDTENFTVGPAPAAPPSQGQSPGASAQSGTAAATEASKCKKKKKGKGRKSKCKKRRKR